MSTQASGVELRERLRAAALQLADALADLLAGDAGTAAPVACEDGVLLTVRQLGEQLHRSPSTVRAWVEAGRFAGAVKVGRGWLVPAVAVSAFLDGQRPDSPAAGGTISPVPSPRPRPRGARDATAPDLGAWRRVPRGGA